MTAIYDSLELPREMLLSACAEDIINEFTLLYTANKSRETYPHWKFEKSCSENFHHAQCLTYFPIKKNYNFSLNGCLQVLQNIACSQRSRYQSV